MSPTVALLPSPLLGRLAWEPVRDALWARQVAAFVVGLPSHPETPIDVLDAFVAGVSVGHDVVLVPHSNAGVDAPAVAAAVGASATVFVDAAMPTDAGSAALAPPDFYEFLTTLADADGLLPPWSQWWDPADVDRLFPSKEWSRRVAELEPRLPLAYFSATVAVPDGRANRPCAYIGFGDTYADEIGLARQNGWPVSVLPGEHLQLLHDPASVADEIVMRAAELGVGELEP